MGRAEVNVTCFIKLHIPLGQLVVQDKFATTCTYSHEAMFQADPMTSLSWLAKLPRSPLPATRDREVLSWELEPILHPVPERLMLLSEAIWDIVLIK